MYSIRHFLLAALTALSCSALVESAALSAGHQMARQKAFANLAIHAARTDLGTDHSTQQSGGNQLSTAARWALVSELRDQIDEIKSVKQQEHGILSHADRWNLPLFKRLHNCILASLSETEDYTGILLFGKSERDLLQQSKGFSACDEEELDVFVAVGTPFSGLIDGTASEPWVESAMDPNGDLENRSFYVSSIGQAADLYDRFPSLIKLVLASEADVRSCVHFGDPEHAVLLGDEDVALGARVLGYQFDSKTSTRTVRISKAELEPRGIDVLARQWETEYQVQPYGFQSLDPRSSSKTDADVINARDACVRRGSDDNQGIPMWKLYEWLPLDGKVAGPKVDRTHDTTSRLPTTDFSSSGDRDRNLSELSEIKSESGDLIVVSNLEIPSDLDDFGKTVRDGGEGRGEALLVSGTIAGENKDGLHALIETGWDFMAQAISGL